MNGIKVGLSRKSLVVFLAVVLTVTFGGCGLFSTPDSAVYISQSVIELEVGDAVKLSAVSSDKSENVTWISSVSDIASVDESGTVTAKAVGEAVITAATDSALATCTVKVRAKSASLPSETLTLTQSQIEIEKGGSVTLKATSQLGADISWESSNPAVASVSGGRVTALAVGTATVTAKTDRASASCKIVVTEKQTGADGSEKDGYILVWRDEFDGASLDTSKWDYQLGTKDFYNGSPDYWGNDELQYYTREAVTVEDGALKITASRGNMGDRPYTSGRILTRGKASWTFGYIEARMKTPAMNGMWPAFWMLPQPLSADYNDYAENEYGGWAASGEIDIMEAKGRLKNQVDMTIHYGGPWPDNRMSTGVATLSSNTDEWHTYAVEWTADYIAWIVDGMECKRVRCQGYNSTAAPDNPSAPFDKPFYILLDLAVGGKYDNYVEPGADFTSASMYVDYVRVYEAV